MDLLFYNITNKKKEKEKEKEKEKRINKFIQNSKSFTDFTKTEYDQYFQADCLFGQKVYVILILLMEI